MAQNTKASRSTCLALQKADQYLSRTSNSRSSSSSKYPACAHGLTDYRLPSKASGTSLASQKVDCILGRMSNLQTCGNDSSCEPDEQDSIALDLARQVSQSQALISRLASRQEPSKDTIKPHDAQRRPSHWPQSAPHRTRRKASAEGCELNASAEGCIDKLESLQAQARAWHASWKRCEKEKLELQKEANKCRHGIPGNKGLCTVCLDRQATHAIIPCGHLALCQECSQDPRGISDIPGMGILKCPVCRQAASSLVRIFQP